MHRTAAHVHVLSHRRPGVAELVGTNPRRQPESSISVVTVLRKLRDDHPLRLAAGPGDMCDRLALTADDALNLHGD